MRVWVASVVVLATLPYLALKVAWLTGAPIGVEDPAFLSAPGIVVANVVTAALDVVVVVLAVVLARGTGRVPTWMVILPGWVGTGFLVPIAVTTPPGLLLDALAGTTASGPEPLAGWVQPLVYLGFTVQGVGLVVLLGREVRRRWPHVTAPAAAAPWVRTLAALAAVPAAALVALELAAVVGAGVGQPAGATWTPGGAVRALVQAVLIVAGVLGVRAVGGGDRRPVVLCAAAVGSAAPFAWGAYAAATTLGATAFATASPVTGLASLVSTLLGLALGVALLACCQPAAASTSASKQVRSPV